MPVPKKKTKKKAKRKVLSPAERQQLKRERALNTSIKSLFKHIGFEYISTNKTEKKFGEIIGDLDGVYLFENIIILCEETTSSDTDHIRKKEDYFNAILDNKQEFLNWVKKLGPDKFKNFEDYPLSRYKMFPLYVSESTVEENVRKRHKNINFLGPRILKYFLKVASSISFSARNEFYRYLGLELQDIGNESSSTAEKTIDSAVVLTESSSGFPPGVQVVSFVMKAQELLDCAYVFRRDSWENTIGQYYQRLVDKKKISKIREYIATKGKTFLDNIIITLPPKTSFTKVEGGVDVPLNIHEVSTIANAKIRIPYSINSIGIIDGQHRVYGHHEGSDKFEVKIATLRKKRHLLITGIVYKDDFDESKKRAFESELFLLMNSNHSRVAPDLLYYIETLKSPLSALGIAGNVIAKLNEQGPFMNMFLLSPLDKNGIKTPTILKFGLQGIVEMSNEKETLFKYWGNTNKEKLLNKFQKDLYEEYIDFCTSSLNVFFGAVKDKYKPIWNFEKDNRVLTSTTIVAFLKSLSTALAKYKGVKNFDFYKTKLSKLTITFKKGDVVQYSSSHWPTLAAKIDQECWK